MYLLQYNRHTCNVHTILLHSYMQRTFYITTFIQIACIIHYYIRTCSVYSILLHQYMSRTFFRITFCMKRTFYITTLHTQRVRVVNHGAVRLTRTDVLSGGSNGIVSGNVYGSFQPTAGITYYQVWLLVNSACRE